MPSSQSLRVEQSRQHFSHPCQIWGDLHPTGIPLLDEYLSSCLLTLVFAIIFYFLMSTFSYVLFYWAGGNTFTPKKQQYREYPEQKLFDIKWSLLNILGQTPLVTALKMTYPYYSKIQYDWNLTAYFPLYLLFHVVYDQFFTYWIHRILHHSSLYHRLHSVHHKSQSVTPYSGFAFHPIDAFLQAVPVFTSCFFVPLPLDLVLAHGIVTSLWAISIHDNVNLIPFKGILYAGSHSIHHFPWGENYNYGKITSVCDRVYGSYCDPEDITGYGYKTSPGKKAIMDSLNWLYEWAVPDYGRIVVEKECRRLVKQKWDKIRQRETTQAKDK